jgi:ABC-2 type transport system permease protein
MMKTVGRITDLPLVRRHEGLRTFITASWLGWQIESNWADPLLFAIYSVARPLAGVMILVVMYSVITDSALQEPIFAYIYLGNALYILVGQVITGVSWAVISDREHYRTLRQLYTTPMNGYYYLMGRGVAKLIIAAISVIIVIGLGKIFFRLPVFLAGIDWPLFLAATVLGIISLASLGLILGSLTMMMARHFWSLGDAIAGGLFLFSGAIFPLDVLPAALRPLGFIFPVTYWLEAARRALLGPQAALFPTFARFSDASLVGILVVYSIALLLFSSLFYSWSLRRAKEKGLIDMETGY